MDIQVSRFGASQEDYQPIIQASFPWPEDAFLQAGHKGLVLVKSSRESYYTAFIEIFVNGTFIRAESDTIQKAETILWEKFQKTQQCANHEWESRNYTNGAGFCKHCNFFKPNCFTGKDLGQFCEICGVGTTWGTTINPETRKEIWCCETHAKPLKEKYFQYLQRKLDKEGLTESEEVDYSLLNFYLNED